MLRGKWRAFNGSHVLKEKCFVGPSMDESDLSNVYSILPCSDLYNLQITENFCILSKACSVIFGKQVRPLFLDNPVSGKGDSFKA